MFAGQESRVKAGAVLGSHPDALTTNRRCIPLIGIDCKASAGSRSSIGFAVALPSCVSARVFRLADDFGRALRGCLGFRRQGDADAGSLCALTVVSRVDRLCFGLCVCGAIRMRPFDAEIASVRGESLRASDVQEISSVRPPTRIEPASHRHRPIALRLEGTRSKYRKSPRIWPGRILSVSPRSREGARARP